MNAAQIKFLMDLANEQGVQCRSTLSYCFKLTFPDGQKTNSSIWIN